MKRDPRLQGLSSDHHQSLVLARRVARRATAGTLDAELAEHVARTFRNDLEPHFVVEEDVLLRALEEIGEDDLVRRTLEDHGFLRATAKEAERGALDGLAAFADRLTAHVRFEERALFPACEEKLPDAAARVSGPAENPLETTDWLLAQPAMAAAMATAAIANARAVRALCGTAADTKDLSRPGGAAAPWPSVRDITPSPAPLREPFLPSCPRAPRFAVFISELCQHVRNGLRSR